MNPIPMNPAPFLLLPQIPVALFALWLYLRTKCPIVITMPNDEIVPIGKRIKIMTTGGPAPHGLVAGQMYICVWSAPGKFGLKLEGKAR